MDGLSQAAASSPPSAANTATGNLGGIFRAIILVGALVLWNAYSDVVSEGLGLDALPYSSPRRLFMHGVGITVTCGAIVGLGCVAWNRTSLFQLGWTLREPARWLVHGLLMTALFVAGVFGVYGVMAGEQGIVDLATAISTMSIEDRSFFLVMGARNAFLEETLFRGSLLIALEKRWGSVAAILLSAAIHALHHRAFAPVPLLVKFVFAIVLAVSVVRTRSLVPAAIAHALLWAIAGYA